MKGIILAGGSGTRLYPITKGISKQLMPIYDKPMIYYPLCTLLEAGIDDILIITTPKDQASFKNLLGDGSQLGISLTFEVQPEPKGLAEAFIIGEDFIGDDRVALILGDNIFHGHSIGDKLATSIEKDGATIFAYSVSDPERYGVVEFDDNMNAVSIQEKPENPKSSYAVTGLYFYDKRVVDIAKKIQPSQRGELEITDINDTYLKLGELNVEVMDRGDAYLDTGNFASMMDAAQYVEVIEKRTGRKIGCIEEAAYNQGFIDKTQLQELAEPLVKSGYGQYLLSLD